MTSLEFTLHGTPQAKGRPRFYNGRAVTDAKTRAAEQSILAAYLVAAGSREPHDGPVSVEITCTFRPADSWPKWKRERALAGEWPHLGRPDLDNLLKLLDGLNGVAWLDDSQLIDVRATKHYGPVAATTVRIDFRPSPEKPTTEGRKTK